MPRAKGGFKSRRRVKKLLKKSKGFVGGRNNVYSVAKQAVNQALLHAYADRKINKRNFRNLWIIRINAAVRPLGLTYNRFVAALKRANVSLNRKSLAYIAFHEPDAFRQIVEQVKAA